ncbi:MAG: flagellin [Fibrobacter sp.]|jgi:flagellin|nr:flagellin [Fibrobacter sp.]
MQVQNTGINIWAGSKKTEQTLKRTSKELNRILEKLSTSIRINSASDDAAGLAISEELTTRIRGYKMASQNIANSISAFTIADGTGRAVSEILQRQRELAAQASNSTLKDSDRVAIDKEFQLLSKEIDRISQSASFNKQGVAAGEGLASGSAVIQSGPESTDQITMPQIDLRTAITGISEVSLLTLEDAVKAIGTLDEAISSVNTQRSTLGSAVNRLESTVNNLSVAIINTQAAESVIRDQDMAAGLAELTRLQLLQEGSQRAFSRFKTINSNHILGLLG